MLGKVGFDISASAVPGLVLQPHSSIRAGDHGVAGGPALQAHLLDGAERSFDLLRRHGVLLLLRRHQDVVGGNGKITAHPGGSRHIPPYLEVARPRLVREPVLGQHWRSENARGVDLRLQHGPVQGDAVMVEASAIGPHLEHHLHDGVAS